MQVFGGVVAKRRQVEPFEQLQLLQEHRALTPRPALHHIDAAIRGTHRLLDAGAARAVLGKVLQRQQTGVRFARVVAEGVAARELDRGLSNWARVEVVDGGLDSRLSAAAGRAQAGVDGSLQCARPFGVADQRPLRRRPSILEVEGCRGGPVGPVPLGNFDDGAVERGVHREAAFGQIDGWSEDVRQRGRAEVLQRRAPRRELSRHRGRQEAVRGNQADAARTEPVDRRRPRRPALSVDGDSAVLVGEVDEDRRFAANSDTLRLEQGHSEAGRNARVDGVATFLEQAQADRGGQVVAGGHHAQRPLQDRACGKGNRSRLADRRAVGIVIGTKCTACGVRHPMSESRRAFRRRPSRRRAWRRDRSC